MNELKPLQKFMKDAPTVVLNEKDFNTFLLKFGAFLFLINNKNINPTFLFLALVKDENLQKIFYNVTGMVTLTEVLKKILINYPNLIKSKIVKDNSIKILKKKEQNLRNEYNKIERQQKKAKQTIKRKNGTNKRTRNPL